PARVAHGDLLIDTPETRTVRARYPRLGIAEGTLRTALVSALTRIDGVPDPVPPSIATRESMRPIDAALRAVHGLGVPADADRPAVHERLEWVEAFPRVRDRLAATGEGTTRAL